MTPGEMVQMLIKDHGTTQLAVAAHMQYHPRHVHKVCRGERMPSAFFILNFAEALGIEPDTLWRHVAEYQLAVARQEQAHERNRRLLWKAETFTEWPESELPS